ncbi:hypothetical protein FBU31_002976, partial [Coemansia sp. 'formosensis']
GVPGGNVSKAHLSEIFGKYGDVVSVQFGADSPRAQSSGVAYLDLGTPEAAQKAKDYMDGGEIRRAVSALVVVVVAVGAAAVVAKIGITEVVRDPEALETRIVPMIEEDRPLVRAEVVDMRARLHPIVVDACLVIAARLFGPGLPTVVAMEVAVRDSKTARLRLGTADIGVVGTSAAVRTRAAE